MNRPNRRLAALCATLLVVLLPAAQGAPSISDFNPKAGSAGAVITITGSGFVNVTSVTFGDSNGQTTAFTVDSQFQLRVIVPLTANSGSLQVNAASGSGSSGLRVFEAGPRLTFFTPASGAPGTMVRMDGANFALSGVGRVTNVSFNGVPATEGRVIGATALEARVPPNATSGLLEVWTPAGFARSAGKFHVQPLLRGFTPTNGVAGDVITLHGTSFDDATSVRLGSLELPFLVLSPTNVLVTLTTNATTGRFTLTAPGGAIQATTNLVVGPRIVSFSPGVGNAGTNVTLAGGALNGVQEVRFNGVLATFTSGTVNQLTTTVPANPTTGPISIRTTSGTYVTDAFFHIVPTITGITPSSGTNGTLVTINGRNLGAATNVTLNGAAAPFTVVSSNQVTAIVPAAATSGFVEVGTPGGLARSGSSFAVLPVISGFSPVVAARGAAIEMLGTGLTNIQAVTFTEGAAATFTALTPNRLRAIVPASAFSGPVTVRTAAGTATSAGSFFVTGAAPTITSFNPMTGGAGTEVTIRGTGLRSAQAVDFNGTPAAFRFQQVTNLVATVPAGATTGPITVTTVDGAATSAASFNVPLDQVTLGVSNTPPNVVFYWPTNAPGFALEFTLALQSNAVWNPLPIEPVPSGSHLTVTLPATGAGGFFRLRK
ncbi:MAG: IPT/TIG domain-containing protein [Limisphaerales bacterium]